MRKYCFFHNSSFPFRHIFARFYRALPHVSIVTFFPSSVNTLLKLFRPFSQEKTALPPSVTPFRLLFFIFRKEHFFPLAVCQVKSLNFIRAKPRRQRF
jgi:hypothetical protein